jgi:hypothetical protein
MKENKLTQKEASKKLQNLISSDNIIGVVKCR